MKPMANVGLLDTPAAAVAPKHLAALSSGFDSGVVQEKPGGGPQVSGAGFDEAAVPGAAKARRLTTAGFDVAETPSARAVPVKNIAPIFEGIRILEKPQPVYTEEARRLRIEGTVRLRVVFGAAGQIRVVSVVKGLGHGLDEAAVQAAEAIRFRPARRDGRPVDAPAVIQIQFQIA
jgi:TonB family protein